jgi:hypothetical protein
MRTADKPGTYRIRQKGSEWFLSGVTQTGRRVKQTFDSEGDARSAVSFFFPSRSATAFVPPSTAPTLPSVDDWGIPLVQADTAAAVADAMGFKPAHPTTPLPAGGAPLLQDLPIQLSNPEDDKKARENRERAKTLCEFLGVAWASGDVWIARRMTRSLGKDPVNPSTKQVNKLADAGQEALSSLFGDREIGPWTMALLLSISLPVAMILQSPKAAPKTLEASQNPNPAPSSHLGVVRP